MKPSRRVLLLSVPINSLSSKRKGKGKGVGRARERKSEEEECGGGKGSERLHIPAGVQEF